MAGSRARLVIMAAVLVLAAGCATAVDMGAVNSRLDSNAARIEKLERSMAAKPSMAEETRQRLDRVDEDIKGIRREFADSKVNIDSLTERFESLQAFMKEVEQFMAEFRKRGTEIDRSLENMANKLEAEVRSFGEKLRKFMETQK